MSWSKPSGVNTGWSKPAGIASSVDTEELLDEEGNIILDETGESILAEFWAGFRKIATVINTIWNK